MTDRRPRPRGARALLAAYVRPFAIAAAIAAPLGATPAPLHGQARPLSLNEALVRAQATSEAVAVARAGVDGADARRAVATSARLPQLAAYSSFDRALRSEFDGLALGGEATPSAEPAPDLPFGSPNTYRAGLALSQTIFSGGRTLARGRAAASAARAAELALATARAALALEVAESYYDAALSEQLVRIAEGTLAQAESTAHRADLLLRAGRGSEFEWLQARVARDRQRPALIRQQTARDIAMLRLKQLVHLPPEHELALTTPLDPGPAASTVLAVSHTAAVRGEPAVDAARRTVVREAAETLREREQLAAAARAARWPTVSLTSTYERVAYRRAGVPGTADFRTNWTAGARVDLPLLTGGARGGAEAAALAEAAAARATLQRTAQLATLDARAAAARLAAADATWLASEGDVRQAARAHDIALLRYREGLAIPLELTDARLALEAARAERARAARDLLVERLRAALLPELPLTAVAAADR